MKRKSYGECKPTSHVTISIGQVRYTLILKHVYYVKNKLKKRGFSSDI